MATSPPKIILRTQRKATTGIQVCAPTGNISRHILITAYAPSFIKTPACSILTAVGAAACPAGDHEWKGIIGISAANPNSRKGKKNF